MVTTKEKLSITELSKLLNVTDHTLRYYEKEFNLQIPRDSRGRRYYTEDLYNIFLRIKQLRDEGLEIKSIKEILQNTVSDESVFFTGHSTLDDSLTSPNSSNYGHDFEYILSSIECIKNNIDEMKILMNELVNSLPENISSEINASTKEIINELIIQSCKLNDSIRISNKLIEAKLEDHLKRHFDKIDESLSEWRKRNKSGAFKHLFRKLGIVSY